MANPRIFVLDEATSSVDTETEQLIQQAIQAVLRGRTAFVMYAVQRRSWIALGDPVGTEEDRAELVWEFRGLCDRYDGWPVFYQVEADRLLVYLDQGLTLLGSAGSPRARFLRGSAGP